MTLQKNKLKLNLRQLLLSRSEWFEKQILDDADKKGYGFVTPSMNRLFAHMRHRPVSISDLARKMGISRQAAHQTISEAVSHGLVEIVESPDDKRIKLARFSEEGLRMSAAAAQTISKIEKKLQANIGKDAVETLRQLLSEDWD